MELNLIMLPPGLLSERPAASLDCRLYFATDTGLIYRDNGTDWEVYSSAGGGGGGGKPGWDPDLPPETPSDYDDEFQAGEMSDAWAEFDPSAVFTYGADPALNMLVMTRPSDSNGMAGIYQAVPSGDYTIYTRIACSAPVAGTFGAHLALFEDATNTAAKLRTFGFSIGSSTKTGLELLDWTNYNAWAGTTWNKMEQVISYVYLRIRKIDSTYYFSWSLDGLGWIDTGVPVTLTFTPLHMGLVMFNTSGLTGKAFVRFFRVSTTKVLLTDVLEGALVE